MRRVEFIRTVRVAEGEFEDGDRVRFPEERAARYIAAGWARDPDTGEEGDFMPGAKAIQPDDITTTGA